MRPAKPFKFGSMSRRAAITGAALAAMALSACGGDKFTEAEGDMGMGLPKGAKVTVVEYASVTCSHCAAWQQEVWPEFKARYIDTNKIRYVFREFPTNPVPVAAAGFLVARCAGDDRYFDVIHQIMASQNEIFSGGSPRAVLLRIAEANGMTEAQFTACITDQKATAALEKRVKAGIDAGVQGTPSFMVNGEKIAEPSLAALSAKIDAALAKN
jgi:protein-disulfide isomerase